jgi:hypothetical protein
MFTKQEERDKRQSICETCEHRKEKRCGLCGCFLILLRKIKLSKCPANKW